MTAEQILSQAEGLGLLGFSREQLGAWLGELEWMMKRELLDTHEGTAAFVRPGDWAPDRPLTAPEGFERVYLHYLESRADLYNNEVERYNASVRLFNQAWQELAGWFNRNYLPKGEGIWRV